MKKIILSSIIALFLFSAFNIVQDWKSYKFKDEGFKAKFPSEPKQENQAVNTEIGILKIKMYNSEFEDKAFILAVNEYPEDYISSNSSKEFIKTSLTNGLQGAANSLQGKVVESKFFEIDGFQGAEAKIEFQDGLAVDYLRIIMAGNKMYQLQALGLKESTVALDAKIFFDEFDLL